MGKSPGAGSLTSTCAIGVPLHVAKKQSAADKF